MDSVNRIDCHWIVPDEIFIHIFRSLLQLEDRKRIRLTCRRFYELCDDSLIQSTEIIALRGTLNTVPALRCLSKSGRRIHNIELRRMHLTSETVLPLFELHGPYVRSLSLINCSFDRGAMKDIIEQCRHLHNFYVASIGGGFETVLNDLEDLVHNAIVRDCVTDFSLILSLTADIPANRNILHFFDIFPGISKLNLDIRVGREDFWRRAFDLSRITPSDVTRCLLAMADQLEVLHLYIEDGVPNDLFNIRMKNLKELSYSWFFDLPDIPSLYHSSLFERLTHFNCSIYSSRRRESPFEVVYLLLQYAPLQSLTITDCEVLNFTLFKALVNSKLRTLKIRRVSDEDECSISFYDHCNDPDYLLWKNTVSPNYYLRDLLIDPCEDELALLFATHFPNANHFEFSEIRDEVLEIIFEGRTNTRSLHLSNCGGEFCPRELSYFQDWLRKETINREFSYLTELNIVDRKYSLTCCMLDEFVFPVLKKLTISVWELDEFDAEQLSHLISKLSQLQSLNLDSVSNITYEQWLTVCKSLTKLRHFQVRDYQGIFTLSEYVQLFDVSPSLRTITHRSWCEAMKKGQNKYFFYDIIEKTVIDLPTKPTFEDDNSNFHLLNAFLA